MELLTAKSAGADIISASLIHVDLLRGAAKMVIGLRNLVNKKEIREKLVEALKPSGLVEVLE